MHGDGSLGACGTSVAFIDMESPAGTLDGVNTGFVLSRAPTPSGSLMVFRNGLLQKQGVDYAVSSGTVTFLSGSIPQPGDLLQASYRALP